MEYKPDKLRDYIEKSELVTINDNLKIRLSKELLEEKYNKGAYNNRLTAIKNYIELINNLGIKYPGNAKPNFYLYIVPDDNFVELLNYPSHRSNSGGGKPVDSYDLDSFNYAFGLSSNKLDGTYELNEIGTIHELSHLVHSMFFSYRGRFIAEGFAESLPLYIMDYQSKFDEHREILKTLTKDQILSANELVILEKEQNFNAGAVIPNESVTFDYSYISSYLFVRGCMEIIADKFKLDRVGAAQKFLEIVRLSKSMNQHLVFDIANALDVSKEELLNGKQMQLDIIKNLK